MANKALIGADPEAFVNDGDVVSHCINKLGGSKDKPRPVDGGGLQEDNVLFEFNVDPTADAAEFAATINKVLEAGRAVLIPHGLFLEGGLSSFTYDSMEGFPEKAFEFGCTPDYNGYTGAVNPKPSAANPNLRTAGGHVHIGYSHLATVTERISRDVVCMCDYLLGLPSLLEDNDSKRRELYGKAGACRLKSYGPEYRTLSNYWIWDDTLIQTVHQRAQKAYDDVANLPLYQALVSQEECQRIINENDVVAAKAALEVFRHAAI